MLELLNTIPDGENWTTRERWLADRLQAIRSGAAFHTTQTADDLVCIEGAEVASRCATSPFGRYVSADFRRFAAAIFCADLACYTTDADQVSFDRLLFVLHAFCEGFRLFGLRDASGALLPVGYSGFYPIRESTFAQLERADDSLANRLIAPISGLPKEKHFLYLFNYSIAEPLRRTDCSRRLLQALAADLKQQSPRGIAAITVSADGVRVAKRFGLRVSGSFDFAGLSEAILTARF